MRLKIKNVLGIIALLLIGIFIGTHFIGNNPDRVVIYENKSDISKDTRGMNIIPASQSQNNDAVQAASVFNNIFVQIAENASPSVVTITTDKVIKTQYRNSFNDDFFQRFFGYPPDNRERTRTTTVLGSGVIVDKNGYILTNNHVVENGEKILVELEDKREFEAEIIGTDPRTDLAVIKIKAKKLNHIILGESNKLRVGEWVAAIGSPLDKNLAHTITAGIVSAIGRDVSIGNQFGSFIQTDAAINPGNSGGALVNIKGELIGINAAIATGGGRGNIGIGFAIPIDLAKKIMKDLIEDGEVHRSWIGVSIQNINEGLAKALKLESRKGVLVGDVIEDGPAQKAGIERGDVIVEVDGIEVNSASHLQYLIGNKTIDDKVKIKLLRDGKEKIVKIKLEEYPTDSNEVKIFQNRENNESTKKLGIETMDVNSNLAEKFGFDPKEQGIVIVGIDENSPLANSVRVGDIIKRIGNHDIINVKDFEKATKDMSDEYVIFLIKRDGNTFFNPVKLKE